jgi:hypothetical protein
MDLQKIGSEDVGAGCITQDRDQWCGVVNTIMILRVP